MALLEVLLRGLVAVEWLALDPPPDLRKELASEGWRVDRELHWALLPNHRGRIGGRRFETNSYGLRDQEIPLKKPTGTFRILTLGDSTVFGFGVRSKETFSEILETRLNEHSREIRFDVINAGVPGYSIFNAFVYLMRDGLRFEPDLIVLETAFNDRRYVPSRRFQDSAAFFARFYHRVRIREELSPSYVYRALRRLMVAVLRIPQGRYAREGEYGYREIELDEIHSRVDPERYAAILDDLADVAAERATPLVLFPLPDSPKYTREFVAASELARGGEVDRAIARLREVDRRNELYRIVVARTINELLEEEGRGAERIRSIPAPEGWMTTDGNVLVSLSDPYVMVMRQAALRDGVWILDFDPGSAAGQHLYLDYIHLNPEGHRRAARALYDLLESPSGPGLSR